MAYLRTAFGSTLLLALMAAGLGGCGGGPERPASTTPADLEALDPTGQQVVFWYQHTREREEALRSIIDEFNQTNPYGISVRGEYAGTYSEIYNKMVVGIQSRSLPQLVVAYQNQALAYYQNQGTVDLNAYMDSPRWGLKPEDRGDLFPVFLEQDRVQGVQIALPPNRSMEVLYCNKDWLGELGYAQPPRTWDEFALMCRKAKTQPFSGSPNPKRSLGLLLDVDASRLASMVFGRGGDFMDAGRTVYTLDTPQVRAALELMRQLVKEGCVELLGEQNADTQEFAVGQVLFVLDSSSGLPFVKVGVKSGLGFAWDVAAPPYEAQHPVVNVYGASVAVCHTTPAQQLAAWLFLKWFTEPAQQARWVKASHYFPVRRSTAGQLEGFFAENPPYKAAYELLEYGKSEPSVSGYEPVRRLIAQAMVAAVEGGDLDRVLGRLEKDANATLPKQAH